MNARRARLIRSAAAKIDAQLPAGLPRPPAKVRRFHRYLQQLLQDAYLQQHLQDAYLQHRRGAP